jgi:hypothetical protein
VGGPRAAGGADPVDDEFAIGFGGLLYEHVLGRGQPVDVAVARALKAAHGPPVSLATPGVFGARAAGLQCRAAAMARASTALAPASGRTGVLLHGMAGAGKTACAVELAYRHRDSFAAIGFWQATGGEFADALANLAVTLETQLGRYGFAMTGHIGTAQELTGFVPRLRQVLSEQIGTPKRAAPVLAAPRRPWPTPPTAEVE